MPELLSRSGQPITVGICAPAHGSAYRKHERCLAALRYETKWPEIRLDELGDVQVSRSIIATSVLELGSDVTMWVDGDVTFDTQTCRTLVREAYERHAVVGALYLGKAFGARIQARPLENVEEIPCFEKGTLLEVAGIGFGCVAVPRTVLQGIITRLGMTKVKAGADSYYPFFLSDVSSGTLEADDYSFCTRARKAGFQVFADTRQRVGHLGEHEFVLEDGMVRHERQSELVLRLGKRT